MCEADFQISTKMYCSFSFSLLLFLLLLSLLVVPSDATAQNYTHLSEEALIDSILTSELETLFKIMESMSSDQTWRTSYPNPCTSSSWSGLECKRGQDSHFHVSRLDFGNSPNPTCKSNAEFPSLIFSLPFLQSVFFFNCFIHTKTSLTISPSAVFNSSLKQLSLRSNPALTGSIPTQISSLKSLQVLTLSQNGLTGRIPVELFSLSSLVHLDLSYNLLTDSIPLHLGSLKNLVGLDFSYNLLTGSIPSTITHLGLLQKLDLSSNSLTGSIPDGIENVSSMVFLALSGNKLQGHFPRGLSKLQSLQYFIMDDNPMNIPLPIELGKLVKLQELRLSNSGYVGIIPPSFAALKNLSTLSLQNNRLSGEIPAGFGDLSRIYHLNLSRNLLSGIVPFNSSFFNRLGMNLDLSGNSNLCVNPSEAYGVKIGVDVCGFNRSESKPLKNSVAPSKLCKPIPLLCSSLVLCLSHVLLLPLLS